jgi:DtxR family transcriptional regulator, Mn-dependent transcriptional regulator
MISAVMEDYLKVIYHLQLEGNERVRTSEIADHLEVTSPTVTSMLNKLEERELIEREKYKGVSLTTEGKRVALEVVRHHRLLETYLTEHLNYSWADVHEEADQLEHYISDEFVARITEALDNPEIDPHGDPIPTSSLELPVDEIGTPLSEFEQGTTILVKQVSDRDTETLEHLADQGIEPGTELTIVEIAPFGMITLEPTSDEQEVSLPQHIARSIRVTP